MRRSSDYHSTYDRYSEVINAIEQDCPDLLQPFLAVPGKPPSSDGDNLITEKTVLDKENRRNLLHVAAIRSAHKCVTMLVNPPYSWDADRPDALGWTPFQIAEDQDDFPTACALGLFSRELRGPTIERIEVKKYGTLSTCLLWPQLHRACNVNSFKFLEGSRENEGRTDKESPLIHFLYTNLGRRIQLTFELLLSDPELLHSRLTTGVAEQARKQHFNCWPLKVSNFADYEDDQSPAEVNPEQHYDQIWLKSVLSGGSTAQSFTNLYKNWIHRRLLQPEQEHAVLEHSCVPPSLKEFCRVSLRRAFVNSMRTKLGKERRLQVNYARLIANLDLPPKIVNYLLYSELWPPQPFCYCSDWRKRIKRGSSFLPWRRIDGGIVLGDGFIPDRS